MKSNVSHQMVEMTVYSDDMFLNLEREKSGDEDTTSSVATVRCVKLIQKGIPCILVMEFDECLAHLRLYCLACLKLGSVPTQKAFACYSDFFQEFKRVIIYTKIRDEEYKCDVIT